MRNPNHYSSSYDRENDIPHEYTDFGSKAQQVVDSDELLMQFVGAEETSTTNEKDTEGQIDYKNLADIWFGLMGNLSMETESDTRKVFEKIYPDADSDFIDFIVNNHSEIYDIISGKYTKEEYDKRAESIKDSYKKTDKYDPNIPFNYGDALDGLNAELGEKISTDLMELYKNKIGDVSFSQESEVSSEAERQEFRLTKVVLKMAITKADNNINKDPLYNALENASTIGDLGEVRADLDKEIQKAEDERDKERKEKKSKRIEIAKKLGEFATSYPTRCAEYIRQKSLNPNYGENIPPMGSFTEYIKAFKPDYDSYKEVTTDPDTEWNEEMQKALSDKKFVKMNEKDTVKMEKLIGQLRQIVEKISIEEVPGFNEHTLEQQEMLKNQAKVAENSKRQYIDNLINTIETGEFTGVPIKNADGNVTVKRVRLSVVDKETRDADPNKYHKVNAIAKKEMDQGKFLSRKLDRAENLKTKGEELPDYSTNHDGDQLRNASDVMGHEKTSLDGDKEYADLGTAVGSQFVEDLEKQAVNPGNGVNFFAAGKLKNNDGKVIIDGKEISEEDLWQYRGVNFNGLSDGGILVPVADLFSETLQYGYNHDEEAPGLEAGDFAIEEDTRSDEKNGVKLDETTSSEGNDGVSESTEEEKKKIEAVKYADEILDRAVKMAQEKYEIDDVEMLKYALIMRFQDYYTKEIYDEFYSREVKLTEKLRENTDYPKYRDIANKITQKIKFDDMKNDGVFKAEIDDDMFDDILLTYGESCEKFPIIPIEPIDEVAPRPKNGYSFQVPENDRLFYMNEKLRNKYPDYTTEEITDALNQIVRNIRF